MVSNPEVEMDAINAPVTVPLTANNQKSGTQNAAENVERTRNAIVDFIKKLCCFCNVIFLFFKCLFNGFHYSNDAVCLFYKTAKQYCANYSKAAKIRRKPFKKSANRYP